MPQRYPRKYDLKKEQARQRSAAESRIGRDIGDIPPVADSDRKARCMVSFQGFCEAYFARKFSLDWSPDHFKVMAKIEAAVLRGGLFSMAMPRGSGKTTLCETACLWALLTGAHQFVYLVGSSEDHALTMLNNLKTDLTANELLLADFPEVVYPIHRLENQTRRCVGQIHHGQSTYIGWAADEIILPAIPGSRAAGAIVRVTGITGNIRGAIHTRPNGESIRPSLVIIDDPQTDQSARSPSQCAQREAIISGAILNLAGPGRKIAAVMPCTVIRKSDMADTMLDREKHPEWQGERTKMVYAFPADAKLWAEYGRIRDDSLRSDGDGSPATQFYREHRLEMDAGAIIAWPARHNPDEISAIQHAMNLRFRDEAAFFAEYQNEPLPESETTGDELTAEQIAAKVNRLRRAAIPTGCNHLTMFIDIQATLLFYVVVGWEDDFTGYIVDYGSYPDQKRQYFTLRDAKTTLAIAAKGTGLEGSIYAGLEALTKKTLDREWQRDDGAAMRIERCLIDANWGSSTDVVYQFCRQSPHAGIVMPSHGRFVGASSQPFSEYKRKIGDRLGHNWRIPNVQGKRAIRHVVFDTNYWKSFVHSRFAVPMGDRGCLSLFGEKPDQHRMFAEQVTAEYRIKTEGRGRTVDEWKLRPERGDNHWLDGLVGCAVAASVQGVTLASTGNCVTSVMRHRVSFAELQRRKRA